MIKNKTTFFGRAGFTIAVVLIAAMFITAGCDNDTTSNPTVIDIAAIPGVTPPAAGATPITVIMPTVQYTGDVTWIPAHDTFEASTAYTATITLKEKTGFTLQGVTVDFFTVAGTSTAATNDANSGVITAVFPDTGSISDGIPVTPVPFNDITAAQLVAKIKIGWNLGNTLDATGFTWLGDNPSVSAMETAWGNPVTSRTNIGTIKNAGFNAVRIPVSWGKAVDSNYTIRADWMERVTEIVNYAVDNDMYIILNTHHDEDIFKFTSGELKDSLLAFRIIWEQIADNFKNYNEKLIFEALNEPRVVGSSAEWSGGTKDERDNLNKYYTAFIDVVRKSGGNNDKRLLMITTYAASAGATAVNGLVLPEDTVPNKLIVSIHAYAPYDFALNDNKSYNSWNKNNSSDIGQIHDAIQPAYARYISKGIPVIMGEFGARDKNNEKARAAWAEYYVNYAKSKGVPCFYWDDGGGCKLLNRSNNTFYFPEVRDALIKGAN